MNPVWISLGVVGVSYWGYQLFQNRHAPKMTIEEALESKRRTITAHAEKIEHILKVAREIIASIKTEGSSTLVGTIISTVKREIELPGFTIRRVE